MLQVGVLAVLTMNAIKNLTNVVIGKLGKLVHKHNSSHNFYLYINHNIIIVQVRYITIERKQIAHIGYNGFLLFQ